jgi:hypothetical protein
LLSSFSVSSYSFHSHFAFALRFLCSLSTIFIACQFFPFFSIFFTATSGFVGNTDWRYGIGSSLFESY